MHLAVSTTSVMLTHALAGCAGSNTIAERTYPGLPESATESTRPDLETSVVWEEPGATFAVPTYGTSACPPIATRLDAADDSVTVGLEPNPQKACTADLAPTTHVFGLPSNVTSRQATVRVVGVGEPANAVLDQP